MNQVRFSSAAKLAGLVAMTVAQTLALAAPAVVAPSLRPMVPIVQQPMRLLFPVATIKVNNAASGSRSQLSFTWEVQAPSGNPVAVVLTVNNKVIMNNPRVALTATGPGVFGSGPQTITMASLANVGNAFTLGLNQLHIQASQAGGTNSPSGADASFVLPAMYAVMPTAPMAEQPLSLSWRLIELIPQNPPDDSNISVSAAIAGQQIYPTPAGGTTVKNCYNKYYPDSAHRDQFGWFGDCGLVPLTIPPVDPLHGPAGLALDATGAQVPITISATVSDANPAAGLPLNIGPYSVQIAPVVGGLFPQFPVAYSATTYLNSAKNWSMDSAIQLHQDGQIVGQTHTHDGIQLVGYHGCVSVGLYDQNNNPGSPQAVPFYTSPPQRFGLDGAAFSSGDRTDQWTAQVDPAVTVNMAAFVSIKQYLCPSSAAQDWNAWTGPLAGTVGTILQVYNSAKSSKVSGSGSQNSSSPN